MTYYKYDHIGRRVETYEHNWDVPSKAVFGPFGLLERTISTESQLGDDGSGPIVGYFETEFDYVTGELLVDRIAKYYHQEVYAAGSGIRISLTEFSYDEAGRRILSKTLFGESPDRFAYDYVDLFPSGQAKRVFQTSEVADDFDNYYYTYYELDDLDRIVTTMDCFQDDGIPYRRKAEFVYGTAAPSWIVSKKEHYFDELVAESLGNPPPDPWQVYTTRYAHDELGRVVERIDEGLTTSVGYPGDLTAVKVYTGLGGVYDSYSKDAPETGMITRRSYNYAGLPVEEAMGYGLGSGDLYAKTQVNYDLKGRKVEVRSSCRYLAARD